ncbi:glutathione peroxidase [Aeoliella mucimassa]|uniref:Glutathione peroxidase n=1 Tax=Aeoliella mucimassa TaxID=2527972 RepID=A0A518AU51_9BACT|nr:glutathione peroxidase [Aeoliella mucimassa]QDU58258.1 hypothetical protein Pan181_44910 [Aeoliella mucimassa]
MSTDQKPVEPHLASPFYEFSANSLRGESIEMAQYAGKVVLVVNTATKCGLVSQLEGLEQLFQQHHDAGLEVLGFPCNQFAGQEPLEGEQIQSFCSLNYGVSFPMFEKIDVNGSSAHPLLQWLTSELPGLLGQRIKWNFTKFLISRDGTPLKRFAPTTQPAKLDSAIRQALAASP